MENPYKAEQEYIDNLLNNNEPDKAFEYINSILKIDKSKDINLRLLSISYLVYITDEFYLSKDKEQNFLRVSCKADKLIKELKSYKAPELNLMLLNFEASLHESKFKNQLLLGKEFSVILEENLQLAISNYWRALRICKNENERYETRNNLANCLTLTGRFVEALSLFNENIIKHPTRFQSIASWSHTAENLKEAAILPEIPSFYFVLAERYIEASKKDLNNYQKESIYKNIKNCEQKLNELGYELSQSNLDENRQIEKEEFLKFSDYRKFVLMNEFALNEHSLHCFCSNAEHDNLSIGIYTGSVHLMNSKNQVIIDSYLNRIKSEFSFARLLYYKYKLMSDDGNNKNNFYLEEDYINTSSTENKEILGYMIEHIRSSYRILYGILDKISSTLLILYNIEDNEKMVYFENLFSQHKDKLSDKDNIHLKALHSMSLDLSQSIEGLKVGSLGFYKKIRNKMEHNLLMLSVEDSNFENNILNINDFELFVSELLRLTKSAIFSLNYLIRTETFLEEVNNNIQ